MKKIWVTAFFIGLTLISCFNPSQPQQTEITGLWKSTDQHSNKPRALVVIYKYHGKYYGRMLATYDDQGNIKDSIVEKKEKAPGVVGHPPYCGMDFIYDLEKEETSKEGHPIYLGKIIDPEKGKVYTAEVWRDKKNLIVRGEMFIFGKSLLWPRAHNNDLPKGFSMSEVKNFVPTIPQPL